MYSVVEISGHQYKVAAGDVIDVEKLNAEVGTTVDFNEVLLVGGKNTIVGAPTVSGASVKAEVIRQARSRKILWMKRRPRGYSKTKGHRQNYTGLKIVELNDGNGNTAKA